METLTAFVRERARWRKPGGGALETVARFYEYEGAEDRKVPPTDIAAVIAVIRRRTAKQLSREKSGGWRFNLSEADLRGAFLASVHLEGADLRNANLTNAYMDGADLSEANLRDTNLRNASLRTPTCAAPT